jgi:hypothetical protein
MANKSGVIGTKTETAVVKVLQANGFPHAERRRLRGRHDPGDVTGTPGIAWSVKGGEAARKASDALIAEWLDRADDMRSNTRSDHVLLVVARRGIGYDNASQWWAVVRAGMFPFGATSLGLAGGGHVPVRLYLADACHLLRLAGYGDPADDWTTSALVEEALDNERFEVEDGVLAPPPLKDNRSLGEFFDG